nr:MAG TPA: hypothetical protein [Caudoviricetes sp.]
MFSFYNVSISLRDWLFSEGVKAAQEAVRYIDSICL